MSARGALTDRTADLLLIDNAKGREEEVVLTAWIEISLRGGRVLGEIEHLDWGTYGD